MLKYDRPAPDERDRLTRPERIEDGIPDARDGLTRPERIVLWVLHETQRELRGRNVPTAMLYGRVVEHVDLSVDELQRILQRLGALRSGPRGDAPL